MSTAYFDDDEMKIEVVGHATGSNEVCAALSVLMLTLVYINPKDSEVRDGYALVYVDNPDIYEFVRTAIELISANYGEYIKIGTQSR